MLASARCRRTRFGVLLEWRRLGCWACLLHLLLLLELRVAGCIATINATTNCLLTRRRTMRLDYTRRLRRAQTLHVISTRRICQRQRQNRGVPCRMRILKRSIITVRATVSHPNDGRDDTRSPLAHRTASSTFVRGGAS